MDTVETVKQAFIFAMLDDHELEEILNITKELRLKEGSMVMQEGEEDDSMYLLEEGEVEVSKSLTMKFGDDDFRQTEKVLTRFKAEDHLVFGEMAMIGKERRSASIMAKTDCILLEIRRDDFLRLLENSPKLGVKVLLKLSELLIRRVRDLSQDVIRLTTALSIALSR